MLISFISFIVAFPGFLVYEVIWGDTLKDMLDPNALGHPYSLINLILYIGLFAVFGVSIMVNLFIYRSYTFKSKLVANLIAFIITVVVLFTISFMYMFVLFPSLRIYHILGLFPYYFFYFSVYVLPNPVSFWYIAIIIYHCCLILTIRMFYLQDIFILRKSRNKNKKRMVYKSQVIK